MKTKLTRSLAVTLTVAVVGYMAISFRAPGVASAQAGLAGGDKSEETSASTVKNTASTSGKGTTALANDADTSKSTPQTGGNGIVLTKEAESPSNTAAATQPVMPSSGGSGGGGCCG